MPAPSPTPGPGAGTPTEAPYQRELRARLFWCARWILGGDSYHAGRLEVVVRDGTPGRATSAVVLRPRAGEEVYDARDGPGRAGALAELAPRLLAAMLSSDERRVVRLVAERGPIAPKAVVASAGVERSKCYVLLSELADRGIIADRGDGYELAEPEVWAALSPAPRAAA